MRKIVLRHALIVCCLTLLAGQAWVQAQRATGPLYSARGMRGFILAHSKAIADVSGSKPWGAEWSVHWLTDRPQHAATSAILAKRGFTVHYFDFDNPQVLGRSVATSAFVEPLLFPEKRVYGAFQLGLGTAFLSKVYHPQTNPTNLFFSSRLSLLAMAHVLCYAKISPQWHASLGFHYNHISNGGMKNPNKGMNFPLYSAGLTYSPKPLVLRRLGRNSAWREEPRHHWYAQAIASLKTEDAARGLERDGTRWLLGAALVGNWRVGRLSHLAYGAEVVHDGWIQALLAERGVSKSALHAALLLGHDLVVGRVRFATHLGAYAYRPLLDTDAVYQRYGLHYRLGRHLEFGATLKAHRQVAEVFDVRLGWGW